MKTRSPRALYAPELLESRIAPATFTVNSLADNFTDGTLRKEIADANLAPGADTIVFDKTLPAGTIALMMVNGEIPIFEPLTIKGPGIDKLTVSGGDLIRIFKIKYTTASLVPTVISGLTIIDGKTANNGGALYSAEALTLNKVVVASSYAAGDGGGVFVKTDGKVLITGCTLSTNEAKFDAGGLYVSTKAGFSMLKSNVSYNTALDGGGMFIVQNAANAPILIDKSVFTGNDASRGGAMQLNGDDLGKMTLSNSVLTGNLGGSGSGVYFDDGNLIVSKTTFSNNAGSSSGGAINDNGGDSLVISGSRFTGNRANSGGSTGGALQLDFCGPVTIKSSVFTGNESSTNGGAIAAYRDETKLTIMSSIFTGNIAGHDGGAVEVRGGASLTMKGSTLTGNVAKNSDGGAIFGHTGAVLTLTGNKFIENHADGDDNGMGDGGAIFAIGNGMDAVDVALVGNLFQGNVAINGGAVRVAGDSIFSSKGDRVIGNVAIIGTGGTGGDGGGFFIASTQPIFITSSLFSANTAADDGGGLVISGTAMLTSLLVADNVADFTNGFGGGIEIASGTVGIFKSRITGNSAARGGGVCDLGSATVDAATKIFGNAARLGPNTDGI